MKTRILLAILLLAGSSTFAQPVLVDTYASPMTTIRLHNNGYKFNYFNRITNQIILFNLDHSVYKTINIPAQAYPPSYVRFVSEELFDLDTSLEYMVWYHNNGPTIDWVYIYNEDGTTLFYRDSTNFSDSNYPMDYNATHAMDYGTNAIYFDGIGTKLRLTRNNGSMEIYSLPGTILCNECTGSIVTSAPVINGKDPSVDKPTYPNPANSEINLYYQIPLDANFGTLLICNLNGTIIQSMKVARSFDYIKFDTTSLKAGTYIYKVITDSSQSEPRKFVVIR